MSGLAFGFVAGLTNIVVSFLGDNHDSRDAITPWQLLPTDRTITLVRTIAALLAFGFAYALVAGIEGGIAVGLAIGLPIGLLFGIVVGMGRLGISAWGRWLVFARLWLPLTRRLPWRPKRFLEDAYHRGVLRQAGAAYQFRHAQLRDHLTRHHRNQPGTTPPPEKASQRDGLNPAPEPQ